MGKYRKKPVVIEAVQWDPGTPHEYVRVHYGEIVYSSSGEHFYLHHKRLNPDAWVPVSGDDKEILPFAFYEVKSGKRVAFNELSPDDLELVNISLANYNPKPTLADLKPWGYVETLEGTMEVNIGDWIICGVQGEYYPCRPDIFEATYEVVLPGGA